MVLFFLGGICASKCSPFFKDKTPKPFRRFSVFRLQILNKMSGITKAQLKEMMENEVRFKLCRAECKIPWLFSEYLEVERWIDSEEESNISSR